MDKLYWEAYIDILSAREKDKKRVNLKALIEQLLNTLAGLT